MKRATKLTTYIKSGLCRNRNRDGPTKQK